MNASLNISQVLPGVHRVRRPRADGGITEFWYAYRGGPQILRASAPSDALLAREVAMLMPKAIERYQTLRKSPTDRRYLYGLITRYLEVLASNESLAPRTKRDRRKHLDRVREDLGELELRALESRHARRVLIEWRDRYRSTPKTADELLGALSTVLQWAADRGEITGNPVQNFPRIYRVNRAEIIWEPRHLATILAHADPEFAHAVKLAALTGLRESDLIALPWTAVGENAIVWQTAKSRGRRTIVIPITPDLRQLLKEIPKRATTILSSSRNRPWKLAGLAAALRRARLSAKSHAEKLNGTDAPSGLEGLRFHDLRGTAATNFLLAGLELPDVAMILGWKQDKVKEIAARYISGEAMGLAMVTRLTQNASKTESVKCAVKRAR